MRGARDWARRARDLTYYLGLLPAGRRHWQHVPRFMRDACDYRDAPRTDASFAFAWDEIQPVLAAFTAQAGHYFHQVLGAARRILAARPSAHVDSLTSLSARPAIEHIGPGPDSDAIAPDARRKAVAECQRILAPGGRFYLGTPVGREHLHFNSGRVFDPRTIIAAMPRLGLTSFNAVDDSGALIQPADPAAFATAEYTCGLFEFTAP